MAVPKNWPDLEIADLSPSAHKVLENRRYQLLAIEALDRNLQPVSNANGAQLNDN